MLILIPIFLIAWGVIGVIFPRIWWYTSGGWKFNNVGPSNVSLIVARIGGILAVFVGIFLFKFFSNSFGFYVHF